MVAMRAATPALERLMNATVRVGGGTGVLVANGPHTVVVTANHVVTAPQRKGRDAPVPVWFTGVRSDCPVLVQDATTDLAVLAAPHDADGVGLALLDREMVPGEELWTCGHPRGWTSTQAPVLCRGIVAGVDGGDRWANLEASWGNSGGALALAGDGRTVLGGIALGRAGKAHGELHEFGSRLETGLREADEEARPTEALVNQFNEKMKQLIAKQKANVAKGPSPQPLSEEQKEIQDVLAERLRTAAENFRLAAVEIELRADLVNAQLNMTDFIDQHFRTGFVRFAGATAIRKLLGDG